MGVARKPVPANKIWTDERLDRLRELAGRVPSRQIAREFGLTGAQLQWTATRYKISLRLADPQTMASRWPEEKLQRLRELAPTVPVTRLSVELEVHIRTLQKVAAELGITLTSNHQVWTSEALATLKRMADESRTAADIAKILGMTRNAVIGRCHRDKIQLQAKAWSTPRPGRATPPRSTRPLLVVSSKPAPLPAQSDVGSPARAIEATRRVVDVGTVWVKLRGRDGRWLSLDGLSWVDQREHGYRCRRHQLAAARAAFPLARECADVDEPAWAPRDMKFGMAMR